MVSWECPIPCFFAQNAPPKNDCQQVARVVRICAIRPVVGSVIGIIGILIGIVVVAVVVVVVTLRHMYFEHGVERVFERVQRGMRLYVTDDEIGDVAFFNRARHNRACPLPSWRDVVAVHESIEESMCDQEGRQGRVVSVLQRDVHEMKETTMINIVVFVSERVGQHATPRGGSNLVEESVVVDDVGHHDEYVDEPDVDKIRHGGGGGVREECGLQRVEGVKKGSGDAVAKVVGQRVGDGLRGLPMSRLGGIEAREMGDMDSDTVSDARRDQRREDARDGNELDVVAGETPDGFVVSGAVRSSGRSIRGRAVRVVALVEA